MPKRKSDNQLEAKKSTSNLDYLQRLPTDVMRNAIGEQLDKPDVWNLYRTSKHLMGIFQLTTDTSKALKYVVEADVGGLVELIKKDPAALFQKGHIKAPRGQNYFDVSAWMLMRFLCDDDMRTQTLRFIPEKFNSVIQNQNAELGCGGADLVKLDFDPLLLCRDEFNKVEAFHTEVNYWGAQKAITFPLLENPDGILFWQNAARVATFYYARRETKEIYPITLLIETSKDQEALDHLILTFNKMENNSSCRSTDSEHRVIEELMGHQLHRQGIHYSINDKHYCDSHTPFQIINRYREAIRLHENAMLDYQWDIPHESWQKGVGLAQGEEMWLLQRICEENRPLDPLPESQEFQRGFLFEHNSYYSTQIESVFKDGHFIEGLGSRFALIKGREFTAKNESRCWGSGDDLFAICKLIADAKAKTFGHFFELEPDSLPSLGL